MTKRNWDRADHHKRDPGSVIDVPDFTRPSASSEERKLREAERANERRAARERSEQHDRELLVSQAEKKILRKEEKGIALNGFEKVVLRALRKPL